MVREGTQGSTFNDYVYAGGLLIAKITGGSVYYYHQDHLGNTRLVTLGSNTSFSSGYEPYGVQYGASGTDPVYKYTEKPQSPSTGLYYYGARWYNQSLGRFLTWDPSPGRLSNPQSLNLYVYVLNNPLRYTDPTGMSGCNMFNWNTWGGCVQDASQTVSNAWNAGQRFAENTFVNGVQLAGRGINTLENGYNAAVYVWNHDSNLRTIVISGLLIGVVAVATGGLGLAVAPVLLGAVAGGGASALFYAGSCGQTAAGCSAEGALAAVMSGVALGALGGVAGPLAGASVSSGLGISGASAVAATRLLTGGVAAGTQYVVDSEGGKGRTQTYVDTGIAFLAGAVGAPGQVETPSSLTWAASYISTDYAPEAFRLGLFFALGGGFSNFFPYD